MCHVLTPLMLNSQMENRQYTEMLDSSHLQYGSSHFKGLDGLPHFWQIETIMMFDIVLIVSSCGFHL